MSAGGRREARSQPDHESLEMRSIDQPLFIVLSATEYQPRGSVAVRSVVI
jgi:hypothetical protein